MATDTTDCRRVPPILATLYHYLFRLLIIAIPDPHEVETMVDILDGHDQDHA